MTAPDLRTERRDGALWLTFDRPAALNAVTPAMLDGIDAALDLAASDRSIRSIVLTGTGRAFCAGADLKAAQAAGGPGANDAFVARVMTMIGRLEAAPLPIVAAVNGLCIAAGLEFVLACDLVIAAASARFGDGHARYGLLPGGGASARLPRKVGPNFAKYMMFTADLFPAERMMQAGLVQAVVADDALIPHVEGLVATLGKRSPLGLARMKRLVDDALDAPLSQALAAEREASRLHAHSADRAEGLAAFAEKREPVFVGA